MARRKPTIGRMRPATYQEVRRSIEQRPPRPSRYECARADVFRRSHLSRSERRWRRQRFLKPRLQYKLTCLYDKVKDVEKLADDVLDLSHEYQHYDILLQDFSDRDWTEVTTLQHALESLQLWLDLGMELREMPNPPSSSESEEEPKSPQKVEAEKSIFEITSSSEEENNK